MKTPPLVDRRIALVGIAWPLACAVAIVLLGPHNNAATYLTIAGASFALALTLVVRRKRAAGTR